MKNYSSQRGVALLTILVMVALATILAATIAKRQTNTAENTGYLMRQNQSLLYAKSAEAFFSELLIQDNDNSSSIDHLQENWAKPMPPFPVEDGSVSGKLLDESGKFNLNNLVKADGKVDDSARRWFEKLLQRVGLPAELSQAVIDWQDADDETIGAMGAESNSYQGLDLRCTHQQVTSKLVSGTFKCPAHGSVFTKTGAVKIGPAQTGLNKINTEVVGKTVILG